MSIDRMLVKNRFKITVIAFNDLYFIEQSKRKIVVNASHGAYWEYCSMENVLARSDDRMYRCHHSLAVNMDMIQTITKTSIELSNGRMLLMCHAAICRTRNAWSEYLDSQGIRVHHAYGLQE